MPKTRNNAYQKVMVQEYYCPDTSTTPECADSSRMKPGPYCGLSGIPGLGFDPGYLRQKQQQARKMAGAAAVACDTGTSRMLISF